MKKLKKTNVKKKTTSQLKKELDKIFSIFIRRIYADENGQASCYTCGARKHWKELQCGHFAPRSHLSTRYLESNCRPQCIGCNIFGGGKISIFAVKLDKEMGKGTVANLYKEANKITKNFPFEEKIAYYKQKLKQWDDVN